MLGHRGVQRTIEVPLSDGEAEELKKSARAIKECVDKVESGRRESGMP